MRTTRFLTAIAASMALLAAAAPAAQKDPETQIGVERAKTGDPNALTTVHFGFGAFDLTPQAREWLDDAAERLGKTDGPVTVGGHTDSIGDAHVNQLLSEGRAQAVRQYLITHGVPAERLTAVGYGETQPIDSNKTREGRANNRRVDLKPGAPPG